MRLLRNMRNEYLMFAERLLETDKVASGLTPSNLFALVAYKNFHLGDFENISRRTSNLDALYGYRRRLVRDSIENLEHRRRDLVSGRERLRTRAPLVQKLGDQLGAFTSYLKSTTPHYQWTTTHYKVDDHEFTPSRLCALPAGEHCSAVFSGETDLATKYPNIADQWHPIKNSNEPSEVPAFSAKKAWWMCTEGHEWEATNLKPHLRRVRVPVL